MNSNKSTAPKSTASNSASSARGGLNLSPEQAKREAGKLREFRDELSERKLPNETNAQSAPTRERLS